MKGRGLYVVSLTTWLDYIQHLSFYPRPLSNITFRLFKVVIDAHVETYYYEITQYVSVENVLKYKICS